jgi:hypothetical protein
MKNKLFKGQSKQNSKAFGLTAIKFDKKLKRYFGIEDKIGVRENYSVKTINRESCKIVPQPPHLDKKIKRGKNIFK